MKPAAGIVIVALALWCPPSWAGSVRIPLERAHDAGEWQKLTLPGTPETRFLPGPQSMKIESDGGFALIYRRLKNAAELSRLRWRWKVEQAGPPTDAARKGGDDRPLAIHVWFPLPEPEKNFWTAFEDGIGSLLGAPPAGRVITYMWSEFHSGGDRFENPHLTGRGRIVIRRGSETPPGRWVAEDVDFRADYRALFGTDAPPPTYLAISADADDTGSVTRAAISDVVFEMKPRRALSRPN